MLLCVLGHLLGRALRMALRRGTLSCLRLLLFLDVLLVFTLLMCVLHAWQVVLCHVLSRILRHCNMQWRYILVMKCGAWSF